MVSIILDNRRLKTNSLVFKDWHWFIKESGVRVSTNWPLQALSQDYNVAPHPTYVVCVNFTHDWQDPQYKIDSGRQIIEELFHGRFI